MTAAASLGATRVIQVRPGATGLTNDSDGNEFDEPWPTIDLPLDAEGNTEPPTGWELVGTGAVTGSRVAGISSLEMPDTVHFRLTAKTGTLPWVLVTHVDSAIQAASTLFIRELAKRMKLKPAQLMQELPNSSFVLDLVTNQRMILADSYVAATGQRNLNLTSLSLYSGPDQAWDTDQWPYADMSYGRGEVQWMWRYWTWPYPSRVGWLGTGDALLKQKLRRERFLNHFKRYAGYVSTFALPHHGSTHNFHEHLITQLKPYLCVAPADVYGRWAHPGDDVVAAVSKQHAIPIRVTSDPASTLWEWVQFTP